MTPTEQTDGPPDLITGYGFASGLAHRVTTGHLLPQVCAEDEL